MKVTTGTNSSSNESWGMGFLLVFFPEEAQNHAEIAKRPHNLSIFPSSSSPINLLHKAQSTISICLLLLFTTALLFTLSTLPHAATNTAAAAVFVPRRHLRESPPPSAALPRALQGVGTLYALGTRAVADLVVAHTAESLSPTDLRLFLRLFFRSGLAARADLALVFPSGAASRFNRLIVRERDSFVELLSRYRSDGNLTTLPTGLDPTHFEKGTDSGEPIWGRRNRGNSSESDGLSYGSVVGFDADELDPENALSGFLDHVPMGLRRWACYPMLLGRVRRNFKNVILVDVKDVLLLGDPLGRVKNHSPESVFLKGLAAQSSSGKHGRRNSEKSEWTRKNSVDPGVVMGGLKGVRRFSNAMLTDIVRFSIQHRKKKNSVTESSIFNHLVGNEHVLKDVNLVVSAESLPEVSSLALSGSKPGSHLFSKNYGVIRRGNSNLDLINSMVMKHICSFPIDSTVYSDC